MTTQYPSLIARPARRFVPTIWDACIFFLVIGGLALVAVGGRETLQPLAHSATITLDPRALPNYALRTTLRMLAAMICSVVFTFVYGAVAVKSRRAEMVLVPLLDILQSLPVFTFLSFTVTFFLALFPGQVLGAELASIFAVFTAQAWNMTFSFYQSLRTVPRDLSDVSDSLRLGAWRRFWVLEAPFAAPGLIWNAMMSMSGAWFFVVIAEAVTVGNVSITLPGIGSYVGLAIQQKDLHAIGWAIVTMALVILAYDQLLFRPLVAWSEKFRVELSAGQAAPAQSWLLDFIQRAQLVRRVWRPVATAMGGLSRLRFPSSRPPTVRLSKAWSSPWADKLWIALVALAAACSAWAVVSYVGGAVGWAEALAVVGLGFVTLTRVLVLIVLASLIWVPIGVLVGLHPKWAQSVQPIAQFMAAFPNNLFFPIVVVGIVHFHLAPDIWLSPLMILGTQWYILFNVIAGTAAFPGDLLEASSNFRIGGWLWWRRVILPGIFSYYVTGAITASGGSWNAAIVAEVATWGTDHLHAHGLGAYIAEATADPNGTPRVVLGVAVMSGFVLLFNRAVWRPMYGYAARRLTFA